MRLRHLLFSLSIWFLVGCSSSSNDSSGTTFNPGCVTVRTYANGVTLTGTADYEYRVDGNGVVNTAVPSANLPIRQAQISVYNSSGAIIQCGKTDNSGNFSIVVPQASANYVLSVDARIYNSVTKAAVFNNPTEMDVHGISKTVSGASSGSVGTLTATATGALKGGAFNILDKIYGANLYLVSTTDDCNTTFSSCTPFTGAPPVFIYWDKGVNPGSYFSAGALSFYLSGQSELYILGGLNGDTDNSDCDHYDNSIILHEYGHFIEDIFSESDSPGGVHTGDSIIDARLAWGEGWANFFQAAILSNPVYRDTSGNVSGSTSIFFNEDLETPDNDIPGNLGEGNFREFSVSRLLWDAIDAVNEGAEDAVTSPFSELWTIFTSSTSGLKNSSRVFRSIGLFHTLQQSLAGSQDWTSIRTGEDHLGNQNDYARAVSTGGACGPTTIQAANISMANPEDGTPSKSNQFASNDFYRYYHSGGAFNFSLSYTTTVLASNLDVYILKNGYRFTDTSSTSIAASATTNSTATNGTETISTTLAAGWYMINIRVDTSIRLGNAHDYTMTLNGAALCPN